jgi:hypothetical protein
MAGTYILSLLQLRLRFWMRALVSVYSLPLFLRCRIYSDIFITTSSIVEVSQISAF